MWKRKYGSISSNPKEDVKMDDLTKIDGIGEAMAGVLHALNITSFSQLASTDDDTLRDILEACGFSLNNHAQRTIDTWNEQAYQLANASK